MSRNGKTFRMILRSVADASEGKNIVFLTPTRAAADAAFRMVTLFRPVLSGISEIMQGRLSFIGGGSLTVLPLDEYIYNENRGKYRGVEGLEIRTDCS